jgi:hypothetical protein
VYLNETLFNECAKLAHRDRTDGTLWHYTDLAGLRGIAMGKSVWLSSYNFMNDPSEGQRAPHILTSCWGDAADQFIGPLRLEREYLRDTSRALSAHGEHSPNIPETFLISFSALGDSLSQWARYGADGAGVALGFQVDPSLLALPADRGWRHGPFLCEVLYDWTDSPDRPEPHSQNRAATARFSVELTSLLTSFFPTVRDPTEADNALYDMVHTLAPLLKNGGYHEEKEWRIVATTTVDSPLLYHLRAGRFGLTPYLELPLGAGIKLMEVRLGPKLAKANRWSVEWLCRKYGIEATVTQSALAYR